jgi:hypothetical protein
MLRQTHIYDNMHCGVSLGAFRSQYDHPVRFLPQNLHRIVDFYPRIQAVYDKPFSEAFVIN